MSNIWLISDTHLGHNKEFVWKARGFDSVWDMNNAIIERWNENYFRLKKIKNKERKKEQAKIDLAILQQK